MCCLPQRVQYHVVHGVHAGNCMAVFVLVPCVLVWSGPDILNSCFKRYLFGDDITYADFAYGNVLNVLDFMYVEWSACQWALTRTHP